MAAVSRGRASGGSGRACEAAGGWGGDLVVRLGKDKGSIKGSIKGRRPQCADSSYAEPGAWV